MLGLSLSRFQAVVGTLAGIASLTGAAFSLVQFVTSSEHRGPGGYCAGGGLSPNCH